MFSLINKIKYFFYKILFDKLITKFNKIKIKFLIQKCQTQEDSKNKIYF